MSHTPGPWKVSAVWSQTTGDTYSIDSPEVREDQEEANVHLIAASPDLLEACILAQKYILGLKGTIHLQSQAWRDLRAAIAKAEGRPADAPAAPNEQREASRVIPWSEY